MYFFYLIQNLQQKQSKIWISVLAFLSQIINLYLYYVRGVPSSLVHETEKQCVQHEDLPPKKSFLHVQIIFYVQIIQIMVTRSSQRWCRLTSKIQFYFPLKLFLFLITFKLQVQNQFPFGAGYRWERIYFLYDFDI